MNESKSYNYSLLRNQGSSDEVKLSAIVSQSSFSNQSSNCPCLPRILIVDDTSFNLVTLKLLIASIKIDKNFLKSARNF